MVVSLLKKLLSENSRSDIRYVEQWARVVLKRNLRMVSGESGGEGYQKKLVRFAVPGRQTFFGYHDKTPFSVDDQKVLACVTPLKNTTPGEHDELEVGMFYFKNPSRFIRLGLTNTWCWQQGCMLQWCAGPPGEDCLIFNRMIDGYHGAVVVRETDGKVVNQYNRPIYCVSPKGDMAISVSFARLHRLRPGYGYIGSTKADLPTNKPDEDGVWRMDLRTGEVDLVISIRKIANLDMQPTMKSANHYFNHLVFNPSGDRFAFFHVWTAEGRRYNRLLTSDLRGKHVCVLTNEQVVSHYCWISERKIVAYANHALGGNSFWTYTDQTEHRQHLRSDILMEDGHPSFNFSSRRIVIDSYPDHFGEQKIFLVNKDSFIEDIGKFYSPPVRRAEYRCDLHPRWDREGRRVCVDSTRDGDRAIYVLDADLK